MITVLVLLLVAAAVVVLTLVVAARDGYRSVPARMETSTLARQAPTPVQVSRLG